MARYIDQFLNVAVPAIVSGIGDGLVLIILEEESVNGVRTGGSKVLERFVFEFGIDRIIDDDGEVRMRTELYLEPRHNDCEIEDIDRNSESEVMMVDARLVGNARSELEYSMKQCLLQVLVLQKRKRRVGEKPDNLSFRLCMRTASAASQQSEDKMHQKSCPALTRALKRGNWYEPQESSRLFTNNKGAGTEEGKRGLYRHIKDVQSPKCGMKLSLGMEVNPFR